MEQFKWMTMKQMSAQMKFNTFKIPIKLFNSNQFKKPRGILAALENVQNKKSVVLLNWENKFHRKLYCLLVNNK